MKKYLVLVLFVFLLTGCGTKNELVCVKKNIEFDGGTRDSIVTFTINEEDIITKSVIREDAKYDSEEYATAVYENNPESIEKVNDKEVIYTETQDYDYNVTSKEIKSAMEGQGYFCNYK